MCDDDAEWIRHVGFRLDTVSGFDSSPLVEEIHPLLHDICLTDKVEDIQDWLVRIRLLATF